MSDSNIWYAADNRLRQRHSGNNYTWGWRYQFIPSGKTVRPERPLDRPEGTNPSWNNAGYNNTPHWDTALAIYNDILRLGSGS